MSAARQLRVHMTLLDDLVLSRVASTEGQHESLDYLPGATLMGAAAAQLYSQLGANAFSVFHSGQVRFGNALPVSDDGSIALPTPLNWQYKKGESWHTTKNGRDWIKRSALTVGGTSAQERSTIVTKQARGGYITDNGEYIKPASVYRMKTAVATHTGRAATSQLFGYHSLTAGQHYQATITASEGTVSDEQWQAISAVFNGTIRLGRSRSAQYGRVQCSTEEYTSTTPAFTDKRVHLLAISDLALQDASGNPSYDPRCILLPGSTAELVPRETAIRTRSYSPYNSYRRCYDETRHVIMAGSVIVFDGVSAAEQTTLANGIGRWQEHGLGVVKINPRILTVNQQEPVTNSQPATSSHAIAKPAHPLIAWLENRTRQGSSSSEAEQTARTWLQQLQAVYQQARLFNGATDVGPTATQWGLVTEALKTSESPESLRAKLFGAASSDAIAKDGDPQWQCQYTFGKEHTFAGWLQILITPAASDDTSESTAQGTINWPEQRQALIVLARGAREFVRRGRATHAGTTTSTAATTGASQ